MRSASVLIVDDSKSIRLSLRDVVESMGHRVLEASHGKEGLELFHAEPVDVVVTDLEMPETGGLMLMSELKHSHPHIPVIVISGSGTLTDAVAAIRLGASDYLVKPIKEGGELQAAIDGALSRGKLLAESEHYRAHLEKRIMTQNRELQESNQKFKTLFESLTDGVLVVDIATCRFIMYNKTMLQMLGYSDEEFGLLAVPDIYAEDDLPAVNYQCEKLHQGLAISFSAAVKRKDGAFLYAEISANSITLDGRCCVLSSFRDITEREAAQEKLKRHNSNLAALRNIDLAISGSLDLQVTLKVLLSEALQQLHVDAACVLLLEPHSQLLEYACGLGFSTKRISLSSVRIGEGYAGGIAAEQKSCIIADVSEEAGRVSPKGLIETEGFNAYAGFPLVAKGQIKGVLEVFNRARLDNGEEWLMFAEMLSSKAAIAVDNAEMYSNLQRSNRELLLAYDTTIEGWSRALDFRDHETEGHSRRVTALTLRIAKEMAIGGEKLVHIRRGSLLHDIGKIGVPDSILLKPGKLSDEEFEIMQRHTIIAFDLISPIEFLRPALDIPYCHHEKWDGSGYPRGLKETAIPLAARIFAVVDVWDALLSNRPYRPAWPVQRVLLHIDSLSGSHFDPDIVKIFKEDIFPCLIEPRNRSMEPMQ